MEWSISPLLFKRQSNDSETKTIESYRHMMHNNIIMYDLIISSFEFLNQILIIKKRGGGIIRYEMKIIG